MRHVPLHRAHPKPGAKKLYRLHSQEHRRVEAAAREQRRAERKEAAVCPICTGRKPVPQTPGLHSLMCKTCWKQVPLELRKTNKRFSDRFKAAHEGATPLTPDEHKQWNENVEACRLAAFQKRGC